MERRPATDRQLARLAEELDEVGLRWDGSAVWHHLALIALDYARRPETFERRVPSFGAIVAPTSDIERWGHSTGLAVERRTMADPWLKTAHLYADGLSSWVVLDPAGAHSAAVFDRPAGSERDLVVLAEATGATMVQRHPDRLVRVVGTGGVHRWDGMTWQHQPPLASWIDAVVDANCDNETDESTLEHLIEFALHDLGARNIGATLIFRAGSRFAPELELRLPTPPELSILHPPDLAPLRHALTQIDGATLFDERGILRQIGVRLIPSVEAEANVEGLRGMRHTAARRYSADDQRATVIVVSESGSVTVLRSGRIVGVSPGPGGDGSGPMATG